MLLHRPIFRTAKIPLVPDWYAIWGAREPIAAAAWQDEELAIVGNMPTISPNGRFAIVADCWVPPACPSPADDLATLWQQYEAKTLMLLPGGFAIVVWDRQTRSLLLARDRVGDRTLYYTAAGNTRYIAPRLATLAPWRSRDLDVVALRDYLSCAFVPGVRTLWAQVREVRPGTLLQFPENRSESYAVWQEAIAADDRGIDRYAQTLRSLLVQVVREYIPAGEPVGVFLSGGLDSSCVTALARQCSDRPVHTYSIHFGRDCPNELAYSDLVARHCQTEHHILEITAADLWDNLPEALASLDDPIGDPLTVPNLLLGKLARQTVATIFNGEGGDPCFGGPKNQPMLLDRIYQHRIYQPGLPTTNLSDPLVTAYLAAFQKCATHLPQLLRSEVWQEVGNIPSVFAEDLHGDADYLNRLMLLNIKFKGADHILTKVNNLTRAAGLQGRSPLFDPRVVELSLQIPPGYKLSGVREKAVLKQAVADLLPSEILERPKSGMMVPVQLWFKTKWQRQAKSLLLDRRAAIAPYINQSVLRDWLSYRGDPWSRYGVKLWLLVSLELWLRSHL